MPSSSNNLFCIPSTLSSGPNIDCSRFSTRYPAVFGPPVWWTLHVFAHNYPDTPSRERRDGCASFLQGLPSMLPCNLCAEHFQEFVNTYQTSPEQICSSGPKLREFLCEAHNNVNYGTGKPTWSCDAATLADNYSTQSVCLGLR
jgi:FAD-linked sulfhydryl oxidase